MKFQDVAIGDACVVFSTVPSTPYGASLLRGVKVGNETLETAKGVRCNVPGDAIVAAKGSFICVDVDLVPSVFVPKVAPANEFNESRFQTLLQANINMVKFQLGVLNTLATIPGVYQRHTGESHYLAGEALKLLEGLLESGGLKMNNTHSTHEVRSSDPSRYDEKCTVCGATDAAGDIDLSYPCGEPIPTGFKHDDEILERLFWEFDDKRKGGGERLDFKNALRSYANSFYVAPETQYQAEEAECAHKALDDLGVPRVTASGLEYSLVGRIEFYKTQGAPVAKYPPNTATITVQGATQVGKTIVSHKIARMLEDEYGATVVRSGSMKQDSAGSKGYILADWEIGMVGNTTWSIVEEGK